MEMGDINVICTELARSLRFYVDILGFSLVERGDWFAHVRLGGRALTLLAVAREPAPPTRYGQRPCLSLDLMTDDLAGELARLRAAGVEPMDDPKPDARRAFLADPDGVVLELIQKRP